MASLRRNPLTDELTDDAKAELAAVFSALKIEYPPVRFARLVSHVATVPMYLPKTRQRSGW